MKTKIRKIVFIIVCCLGLLNHTYIILTNYAAQTTQTTDNIKAYRDLGKSSFNESEIVLEPFEIYSDLDELGRCGPAFALVCKETMPTKERESIGMIKPTGWQTPQSKYDFIDGKFLYNRCHLIAYELTAENANEKNLITGTRFMNVQGMLPFENKVASYVKETGNHVLYRSTPIFEGDNLLCSGVKLEAYSIEDNGEGIDFCVYCQNIQPGVDIDYKTGKNKAQKYII